MTDQDLRMAADLIGDVKADDAMLKKMKEDIRERGYEEKIRDYETLYAKPVRDYIKRAGGLEGKTRAEKAKMLQDIKKQLAPQDQKAFDKLIFVLRMYLQNFK